MLRLFKEKDVRKLVARLKQEYEAVLLSHKDYVEEVKEENRRLRARLSLLESERESVSGALVHAVAEGERIKSDKAKEAENERRELILLAEKCRMLSDRLTRKYPDEEDVSDFSAFTEALRGKLGEEDDEPVFDMDAVLSPKEPLDLEQLCKDLDLMEDDL